jgi:hypothetical protein
LLNQIGIGSGERAPSHSPGRIGALAKSASLVRRPAGDIRAAAKSTVHAVFDRPDRVEGAGKRRNKARGTPLSDAGQPSALRRTDLVENSNRRATSYLQPTP